MRNLHFLPSNSANARYSIFLLRGLVGFPWVSLRLNMVLCLLTNPPLPMTFPLLHHSPLLSFTMIPLSCPPYTISHLFGSHAMVGLWPHYHMPTLESQLHVSSCEVAHVSVLFMPQLSNLQNKHYYDLPYGADTKITRVDRYKVFIIVLGIR